MNKNWVFRHLFLFLSGFSWRFYNEVKMFLFPKNLKHRECERFTTTHFHTLVDTHICKLCVFMSYTCRLFLTLSCTDEMQRCTVLLAKQLYTNLCFNKSPQKSIWWIKRHVLCSGFWEMVAFSSPNLSTSALSLSPLAPVLTKGLFKKEN